MKKLIKDVKILSLMLSLVCTGVYADWETLGPEGGQLYTLTAAPSDFNIIYAATINDPSSIVKSNDGGDTWAIWGNVQERVYSIAVDPSNPDIVYIGGNAKVHKTTDNGFTWTAHTVSDYPVYGLAVHPMQSSTIFAAGAIQSGAYRMSFHKSTDSGVTWSTVQLNPASSFSMTMTVDPHNPDVIFVGGSRLGSIGMPYIYRSTDGGTNFSDVSNGITAGYSAYSMKTHPLDSNIVYFATDVGVFRSTSGGSSWVQVSSFGNAFSLATTIDDPDIIFAGSDSAVFVSTDNGITWNETGSGYYGMNFRGLVVDPDDNANVVTGNNFGCFKTTDGGTLWSESNTGMYATAIDNFIIATSASNIIYMEIDEVGEYRTSDGGLTWTLLPDFLSCGLICAFVTANSDPDMVVALEGTG